MSSTTYNKLVRDKIPEIIEQTGKTCVCSILKCEEYLAELNRKLTEELNEYSDTGAIEELVDIYEVIQAILKYYDMSISEFEKICLDKRNARGGFEKRIFLQSVNE